MHLRRQRARLVQRHAPRRARDGRAGLRPDRVPRLGLGRAWRGVFGGVAYSAAKAAQLGFARALARELGPNGVTVNSVAPGLIDTDITAGKLTGEKEQQVLAGVPVGRKGRAADVADLITYLCREESGYITGATYDVNGGAHIH